MKLLRFVAAVLLGLLSAVAVLLAMGLLGIGKLEEFLGESVVVFIETAAPLVVWFLRDCVDPTPDEVEVSLVAGAGFEPATFGL